MKPVPATPPKMLHSCLSFLRWKNWDAQNYSSRQCAAIRTIASVLFGGLAQCRSWALLQRGTHLYLLMPKASHTVMPGEIWYLTTGWLMPTRSKAQVLRVPEDGEPLRSWAGPTEAAVTASRFSHGSSAAFPNIVQSFKERN